MDPEWETHKETIRDLYLNGTLKHMIKEMKEVHNFHASAGQYERQIQHWGFRKNLTQNDWQFAVRCINKRKREGKDTDFKIDGIPVTQKKLKKAITRYGEGSTWDMVAWQQREGKCQRSPSPCSS